MRFGHAEVLKAVKSLYDDELKPLGRLILRRMKEHRARATALAHNLTADALDPETMPRVDPQRLRELCEGIGQFTVSPEEGREYSVRLLDTPDRFVDAWDDVDVYTPAFWTNVAAYFEASREAGWSFPGGRYSCARALAARSVPCLRGLSLGRVCQVVQISISTRKLLGYRDGSLVPLAQEVSTPPCAPHAFPMPAGYVAPGQRSQCIQKAIHESPSFPMALQPDLSFSPTRPLSLSPGPCVLGEDGLGSQAPLSAGAAPCQTHQRQSAFVPYSADSDMENRGRHSPRPCTLGEECLEIAQGEEMALLSPGVSPCQARYRRATIFSDTGDSGVENRGKQPPRPSMLGEEWFETEQGELPLLSPGVSPCQARCRRAAFLSNTVDSGMENRGRESSRPCMLDLDALNAEQCELPLLSPGVSPCQARFGRAAFVVDAKGNSTETLERQSPGPRMLGENCLEAEQRELRLLSPGVSPCQARYRLEPHVSDPVDSGMEDRAEQPAGPCILNELAWLSPGVSPCQERYRRAASVLDAQGTAAEIQGRQSPRPKMLDENLFNAEQCELSLLSPGVSPCQAHYRSRRDTGDRGVENRENQPPRPRTQDEDGLDADAYEMALVSPGVSPCRALHGRAALDPDIVNSDAECRENVKNTFIHVCHGHAHMDDERLRIRPTRSVPHSIHGGLL